MKFLKYLIFLLLILGIGLAIYIAVQPSEFSVTRTRDIEAPAAVIYDNVNDLKNWEAWSPWVEENPTIKITLGENTTGIGGSYTWEGDDGKGTMKTIEANKNASLKQEMQFEDFPKSDVSWEFMSNEDGGTAVTWNMSGKDLPFGFKAYTTLMGGMENQVGPSFERGLEKLDSIVMNSMKAYEIKVDGITEYGGGFYMYKTTSATSSNISNVMGQQYGQIMEYMAQNNLVPNGMPFTIYNEMNNENETVIMSNAIPVQNNVRVARDSEVLCGYIPKTRVLKTTMKGNYTNLSEAWETAMAHITANNLIPSDLKPFEIYITDPGNYPNPADWITEVYIPIKE